MWVQYVEVGAIRIPAQSEIVPGHRRSLPAHLIKNSADNRWTYRLEIHVLPIVL